MNSQIIKEQKDWISSGKIGCVFASALVKQAEKIGWKFYVVPSSLEYEHDLKSGRLFIASIIFPGFDVSQVKNIAMKYGMFIENVDEMHEGLRMRVGNNISWVQYFGPDSHVKTRRAPYPMLSFCVKLPAHIYAKTMAKGILHLAHASIEHFTAKKANTLWDQSIKKTHKELGYSPTIAEAAKTTFKK